ncbi:MAG: protease modulator HflC [Burkholderiaceae bacterium]|jgi:membrane protease subunit HflC|nr:protease modulator HflC [Burkholderiaceae bacterium]
MNRLVISVIIFIAGLALLRAAAFVVDQRQFGVVYQFNEIQRVIAQPGLNFNIPLIQNVAYMDKRLLILDSADAEPMLTAEKQRVVIDWYVRWRITDPRAFVQNVGRDEDAGAQQLNRVVRSAFQEEINRRTVRELISTRRETLMADVKQEVTAVVQGTKSWGIDIVDVRITRADYAESITESVYGRMRAERQRVANELRSTGLAEGEQIRADADRQREVTVANAYREAQKVRGEGDAEATRVYAEAFNKDPQFAEFHRSLDAYRASIGKPGDVLVIDPAASDFFRNLRTPPSARH